MSVIIAEFIHKQQSLSLYIAFFAISIFKSKRKQIPIQPTKSKMACQMTYNGTTITSQQIGGVTRPNTYPGMTDMAYIGCHSDAMQKIKCDTGTADEAAVSVCMVAMFAASGTMPPYAIPAAADCTPNVDYSASPRNCTFEAVPPADGDCGTCKAAAPIKSLAVVAIMTLIAMLF